VRLDLGDHYVVIALSARNIAALQHKLLDPRVANALVGGDIYRNGQPVSEPLLIVQAEPDLAHYGRRAEPPGIINPRSEAFIAETLTTAAAVTPERVLPWLRFDEHGQLAALAAEHVAEVRLGRWQPHSLWLRIDDLFIEFDTQPNQTDGLIRCSASSYAIDHPPYRDLLLEGDQAAELIHGETIPSERGREEAS
jgi:hypothetical protein